MIDLKNYVSFIPISDKIIHMTFGHIKRDSFFEPLSTNVPLTEYSIYLCTKKTVIIMSHEIHFSNQKQIRIS